MVTIPVLGLSTLRKFTSHSSCQPRCTVRDPPLDQQLHSAKRRHCGVQPLLVPASSRPTQAFSLSGSLIAKSSQRSARINSCFNAPKELQQPTSISSTHYTIPTLRIVKGKKKRETQKTNYHHSGSQYHPVFNNWRRPASIPCTRFYFYSTARFRILVDLPITHLSPACLHAQALGKKSEATQ